MKRVYVWRLSNCRTIFFPHLCSSQPTRSTTGETTTSCFPLPLEQAFAPYSTYKRHPPFDMYWIFFLTSTFFLFARNDNHKQLIDQVDVWGGAAKTAPRIFCGVYTYHANHATKIKVRAAANQRTPDSDSNVSSPPFAPRGMRCVMGGFRVCGFKYNDWTGVRAPCFGTGVQFTSLL